jgi:hypothetical protein
MMQSDALSTIQQQRNMISIQNPGQNEKKCNVTKGYTARDVLDVNFKIIPCLWLCWLPIAREKVAALQQNRHAPPTDEEEGLQSKSGSRRLPHLSSTLKKRHKKHSH